jgi:hypothetical protein
MHTDLSFITNEPDQSLKDRFRIFVKNLLIMVEDAPFIYRGRYIPEAYEQYVSTLERVAAIDPELLGL